MAGRRVTVFARDLYYIAHAMAIYQVTVFPINSRLFGYKNFHFKPAVRGEMSVLYLPVGFNENVSYLDTFVQDIPPVLKVSSDLVVFRVHGHDADNLLFNEKVRQNLELRFPTKSLYALYWERNKYKFAPLTEQSVQFDEKSLVLSLRAAECDWFTQIEGVILPEGPDFHYEGPNGCHYKSFLRIGTALQFPEVLDSLVFWLLPKPCLQIEKPHRD